MDYANGMLDEGRMVFAGWAGWNDEHWETGGYVVRDHGRIYFDKDYQEFIDVLEGDCVFLPSFMKHVEVNMGTTDELVWLT